MDSMEFIAHDWCGWNENYGRFTHMPSGNTLVCKPWMGQLEWDKAQLEYFKQFPGNIPVHESLNGQYTTEGSLMGTVEEICQRLERRVA